MRMILLVALGWVISSQAADPGSRNPEPCQYFYDALEAVPHDTLTASSGEGVWLWHDQGYVGCQIRFVTNDSLTAGYEIPDFDAPEGSEMYRLGWRFIPEVGADGPGSGIFGIQRDSVECLVQWNQEAYIDDEGEFRQSDVLEMTIQCRDVLQSPPPPAFPPLAAGIFQGRQTRSRSAPLSSSRAPGLPVVGRDR